MRRWTIEVNERELRTILHAFDIARDQTVNDGWHWWVNTQYADKLYKRLRGHGLETDAPRMGRLADVLERRGVSA